MDDQSQGLDQLRARRDRLAFEIEMIKNDAEHWNRTHPSEQPIDAQAMLVHPRELLAGIDQQIGLDDDAIYATERAKAPVPPVGKEGA